MKGIVTLRAKVTDSQNAADINQDLEVGALKCVSQLYHKLQSLACLTLKSTELLN